MPELRTAIAVLGVVAVLTAACDSSGSAKDSESTSATAARTCPAAGAARFDWPAPVPSDLPKPAGAVITQSKRLAHGVVVELRVPDDLQGQVRFVRSAFPAARIDLGRGDAEQDEADIPLRRGSLSGQLRLRSAGSCASTWILTVTAT